MNSSRQMAFALTAAALLLTGCEHTMGAPADAAAWGEPNRQTMMAQVVDPDPQYDDPNPPTSAEHAAQAAERYRTDSVKQPVRVRSGSNSGGGGRSGGN